MKPDPVKPTTVWGVLIAIVLAIYGSTHLCPPAPATPSPVVVDTKPAPKVDWPAILRTLLVNVPRTETPADPSLLTVTIDSTTTAGMAELRAAGSFTEIRWNRKDIKLYESDRVAVLVAPPGEYEFVISAGAIIDGKLAMDQQTHKVQIGKPVDKPATPTTPTTPPVVTPDPTTRVTKATYVFEQRNGPVPPPVLAALSKLNVERKSSGFVGSPFDQDTITGRGQVPAQYAVALAEAKKFGVPCLVVEYTSGAPKAVKVATAVQVEEACK